MDDERGVWIEDGIIHIDHAEIEASLHELARRRGISVEEALYRALTNAIADGENGIAVTAAGT